MEQYIEHTLLKAEALEGAVRNLVEEAEKYRFYGICVLPKWVKAVKGPVKVISVVGFPGGGEKREGARRLVGDGVDEIDMVADLEAMRRGDWEAVEEDIRGVVEAAEGRPVKVILETALWGEKEIVEGAKCAERGGAQFVKTSTGLVGGATVEAVRLLRGVVGDRLGVKASGGIKTYEQALSMVRAGANRIGTSSGVSIINEVKYG